MYGLYYDTHHRLSSFIYLFHIHQEKNLFPPPRQPAKVTQSANKIIKVIPDTKLLQTTIFAYFYADMYKHVSNEPLTIPASMLFKFICSCFPFSLVLTPTIFFPASSRCRRYCWHSWKPIIAHVLRRCTQAPHIYVFFPDSSHNNYKSNFILLFFIYMLLAFYSNNSVNSNGYMVLKWCFFRQRA